MYLKRGWKAAIEVVEYTMLEKVSGKAEARSFSGGARLNGGRGGVTLR